MLPLCCVGYHATLVLWGTTLPIAGIRPAPRIPCAGASAHSHTHRHAPAYTYTRTHTPTHAHTYACTRTRTRSLTPRKHACRYTPGRASLQVSRFFPSCMLFAHPLSQCDPSAAGCSANSFLPPAQAITAMSIFSDGYEPEKSEGGYA